MTGPSSTARRSGERAGDRAGAVARGGPPPSRRSPA
jgi:hypothetical protein